MTNMNVQSIKDYIITTDTESCLAINSANGVVYNEKELYIECIKYFYYEKLGWCGCGQPGLAKECVRDLLKDIKNDEANIYDNGLVMCLAYTLDNAGFIEHGTSIGCPWLTEEGEMFLYLLSEDHEGEDE